jgi:hypothetical protein
MKEIDFLPDWYKSGRRRQIGYRTQYVALAGAFALMMAWNFTTARSISKAQAEIACKTVGQGDAADVPKEFDEIRNQVGELQEKAELIGKIDSRIDVASVLGEMSYLIDDHIVLTKVKLSAESFQNDRMQKPTTGSAVRPAPAKNPAKETPLGDVRFKVVISGVASDASDVGELICKLEESPYFCQVIPSFSRNNLVRVGTESAGKSLQVSEFEISCYLANYQELDVGN